MLSPRVFSVRVALLHVSQLRNRPDDAPCFDLLDIIPQLGETLDGQIIGCSARASFDQLAEHVDDTAELPP